MRALGDVRSPNTKPLEQRFKDFLVQQVYAFTIALQEDEEQLINMLPNEFRPRALPSTARLLDILCQSYSDDPSQIAVWRNELDVAPAGWWVRGMFEASTSANKSVLSKELDIQFVE